MKRKNYLTSIQYANAVSDEMEEALRVHLNDAKTFSQSVYNFVYVLDFHNGTIPYITATEFNPQKSGTRVINNIDDFLSQCLPNEDLERLEEEDKAYFTFLCEKQKEERQTYTLVSDYHVKGEYGWKLVQRTFTPMALDEQGNVWLAFCVVSLSDHKEPSTTYIRGPHDEILCYKDKTWKLKDNDSLSIHETTILRLAARGMNVRQIAEEMCKSEETIKTHKQRIFKKLGVNSLCQAIAVACNRRML